MFETFFHFYSLNTDILLTINCTSGTFETCLSEHSKLVNRVSTFGLGALFVFYVCILF